MHFLRILAATALFAIATHGNAQPTGFRYTFDEPSLVGDQVRLDWTLISGSTCNGMQIEHSTDSVLFEQIGFIGGVCGNADFDVSYVFTHETPVRNAFNFYRIVFGLQTTSDIRKIFIRDLNTDGYQAYPNPVESTLTILFNNASQAELRFTVYNHLGQLVFEAGAIREDAIRLDVSEFHRGVYTFIIEDEQGSRLEGRFIRA